MRAWIITVGESLPTDHGRPRLLRSGVTAALLQKRGIETTWWTSSFAHHLKQERTGLPSSFKADSGYQMELLHGRPYKTNVSVARILHNKETAADFSRRLCRVDRPDIILASYPTLELAAAALDYGARENVPVVVDIRDLWPDIYLNLAPAMLRPLARAVLHGNYRLSRHICAQATAITGITEAFVDWGVMRAGRQRRSTDRAFPLAYSAVVPPECDLAEARGIWDQAGITVDVPTVCFFGMLGRQFDIPTVIRAARLLDSDGIRFVICGTGDRLREYQSLAAGISNITFPGWINAAAIRVLMERSIAGLAPYYCEKSYTMSLPTKSIEYLAGGLPIISSLSGELSRLLAQENCGRTYAEGDVLGLVAHIRELVAKPELRSSLHTNAIKTYRARFVAETIYDQMIDYLIEIAESSQLTAGNRLANR